MRAEHIAKLLSRICQYNYSPSTVSAKMKAICKVQGQGLKGEGNIKGAGIKNESHPPRGQEFEERAGELQATQEAAPGGPHELRVPEHHAQQARLQGQDAELAGVVGCIRRESKQTTTNSQR